MEKKILLIPCKEVSRDEKKYLGKTPQTPLFHCSIPGYVSISSKDTIYISTLNTADYEWDSLIEKMKNSVEHTIDKKVLLFGTKEKLDKILSLSNSFESEILFDISLTEKNHAGLINYYCQGRFFTLELSARNITCAC